MLLELAAARVELPEFLAWWEANQPALEAALKPGWYARLKPRQDETESVARRLGAAQHGAIYILDALQVPHEYNDCHDVQCRLEIEQLRAASLARTKELNRQRKPIFDALKVEFPKFTRWLKRQLEEADGELKPGASEAKIAAQEQVLGIALPGVYRRFMAASSEVNLDGFRLSLASAFFHPAAPSEGLLCIADYFWQADGDQVLIDPAHCGQDDPPVFYYDHETPEVRPLAKSFTAWVEGIPRQLR
jgi:hypothetical protein